MWRLAIGVCAILATGCATSPWKSRELATPSEYEIAAISAAATERLAAVFPPGQTTFELDREPEVHRRPDAPFGKALEQSLRQRGFGVATPDRSLKTRLFKAPKPGGHPELVYVLDELGGDRPYRLGLAVEPDYRLDGAYGAGAMTWTVREGWVETP